ncbi:MAG: hypothetical protein HY868_10555 [Chloroflexi bacterium]|nr:hypothetical protein [Chloroflexota bacterium]
MRERQGCLAGLLELFLLGKIFDWLQDNFGFRRGCSGFGCGIILLCIFLFLACNIITGTDWFKLLR